MQICLAADGLTGR